MTKSKVVLAQDGAMVPRVQKASFKEAAVIPAVQRVLASNERGATVPSVQKVPQTQQSSGGASTSQSSNTQTKKK